jgi:hypothetical protein
VSATCEWESGSNSEQTDLESVLDEDAEFDWKSEALGLKAAGSGYLYVRDGSIPHFIPYIRRLRLTFFYATSLGVGNRQDSSQIVVDWLPCCGYPAQISRISRAGCSAPEHFTTSALSKRN